MSKLDVVKRDFFGALFYCFDPETECVRRTISANPFGHTTKRQRQSFGGARTERVLGISKPS